MPSRLLEMRRTLLARGPVIATPARVPGAIIAAIGVAKAAASANGVELARGWRAVERRIEVERLSREGVPVAQIAAQLDLSTRQVVTLRAQLGVGRRR